jgi:hypothetical protein
MSTINCDQFQDMAPDLALGLLAGDDRGAALTHLVACGRCRRQLEGLVQVADDLLLLAPAVEPEIGFESRVMARLAADGAFSTPTPAADAPPEAGRVPVPVDPPEPGRDPVPVAPPEPGRDPVPVAPPEAGRVPVPVDPREAGRVPVPVAPPQSLVTGSGAARPRRPSSDVGRRWARPILVSVAAALIVVAGVGGLIAGVTRGRNSAVGQQARAANQLAARTVVIRADAGRSTCQLVAFPAQDSQPARLVVNLDEPGDTLSSYQVLAEPTDGGPAVVVGTIAMVNGHGMLAVSIPAGTGPVHAVRIIEGAHTVRYRATFESV